MKLQYQQLADDELNQTGVNPFMGFELLLKDGETYMCWLGALVNIEIAHRNFKGTLDSDC